MSEHSHVRDAEAEAGDSAAGNAQTLTHEFELNSQEEALRLLGFNGELRRRLQDQAGVRIVDRGTRVVIIGEESDAAVAGIALQGMLDAVRMGHTPTADDVDIAVAVALLGAIAGLSSQQMMAGATALQDELEVR